MAETAETPTNGSGQAPAANSSWLVRARRSVTPGQSTLYVMGVLLLVSAALVLIASIAYGILATRTSYFEQRNLRELDRIATELNTTREGLAQTATLHFVPQQLHFSLSRQLECLVATSEIMGARQQPITITYYFTDPAGTQAISNWYAAQTRVQPTSAAPPAMAPRDLPPDICGYQRPLGLSVDDETVSFSGSRLSLARTAPLRNLVWPMAAWPRSGTAPDESSCTEAAAIAPPLVAVTSLHAYIRDCLVRAAVEDTFDHNPAAGHSFTYRPPEQIRQIIEQSIDAAFRSNTVRINVSTPTSALDFDSALEIFDAVQIIGSDEQNRPVLLHQAGHVPAAIEGDETNETGTLSALTGLALPSPAGASGEAARQSPHPTRQGDFLAESQIIRTGDLILFQRAVPRLAGLACSPCRIVGIVERGKFDQRVRKIDGVQATMFLIAILTLIGLIPLLQLKLRKRLDATGRSGQYFIWFALTLLAASATISCLAIWSATASRNAGTLYAHDQVKQISGNFRTELDQSIRLASQMGAALLPNDVVYPAPRTLPVVDHLNKGGFFRTDVPLVHAERTLSLGWNYLTRAAIIDTVSIFRGDGFVDRDTQRIAAGRFPGFGTTIGDRPYFNRARNRGFDRIAATGCDFILDRVLARPDGAPRVVLMLPPGGCVQAQPAPPTAVSTAKPGSAATPPARPGAASPASAAAPATPPSSFFSDQRQFYDPTRQEFLMASGTLRTFLGLSLRPGFRYAVIDPHRPQDDANVLFHSREDAELVERFQRELDDPARFDTLIGQALADAPRPAASAGSGARDERAAQTAWQPTEFRMDTNYRAAPSRLTVARLNENMDWVLVIIEDRNDAAFSVWRAATFGYAIWFICVILLGLALIVGHGRMSHAVDRRPGLSLWPRQRLDHFTPPLIRRHARMRRMIKAGAIKRDRHMWWTLGACLIGLPGAEGGSRVLFAMAAATIALSGRSYLQGVTTSDAPAARRSDRRVVIFAAGFLAAAAIAFVFAMTMDYELRRFAEHRQSLFDWTAGLRTLAFLIANCLLIKCLLAAHAHTFGALPTLPESSSPRRRLLFRMQRWQPLLKRLRRRPPPRAPGSPRFRPRADLGWIFGLIVMGGVPAAAGYLDSHDQDRYLVFDRAEQIGAQALEDRRRGIESIDRARLIKLPPALIQQVVDAPAAAAGGAPRRPDTRPCVTLSCLAMLSLDLREQALDYSDFAGFQMSDAFSWARGSWRLVSLPLLLMVPLIALILVLLFFRREFFPSPPLLSPGKDPNFDPPLSLTRDELIHQALLPAAEGRTPDLPFRPGGANRHLILGVGLDLRDDRADPRRPARLGSRKTIQWIDLLDPPATLTVDRRAVVIGNLDLALQVPDEASIKRAFDIISAIAGSSGKAPPGGRHVFLLADIDPLDRIALLWERQGRDDSTGAVEAWRWAALIQDFTLYPIRRGPALPEYPDDNRVLRTIREELGVLDTAFARELGAQLHARMAQDEARRHHDDSDVEADRIVSFITEQMSDHYYKLWASSSDEERVMLYRVARGCHLKMHESRGLRSLLTRGLLVRTPEYRLMNRSFTRYVCRIGETSDISGRARGVDGLDRIWPLIRYPLAAAAASGVLLLQFVAPSAAGGAVGALPALVALLPALLGKWFQGRAATT